MSYLTMSKVTCNPIATYTLIVRDSISIQAHKHCYHRLHAQYTHLRRQEQLHTPQVSWKARP